jgi:ribonuclease HII
VAAAVILPLKPRIRGLDDSKALSESRRVQLAQTIRERAVAYGLGWASVEEIDSVNILQATYLAMRRALLALGQPPLEVRVDGNRLPPRQDLPFNARWQAVVRGDAREAPIAAASILAKTARDRYMIEADGLHPGYGFARHKGYGTAEHLRALCGLGVTSLHRRTFEPVKSLLSTSAAGTDSL